MFPPMARPLCFSKWQRCTSSNAMEKATAALTSTEHYLESQPQRRQDSSGFIDLVTVYYTAATQI